MDTFALRSPGLVHLGLFLEIMRDMRPLISSLSPVIISLVMAVAGRYTTTCFSGFIIPHSCVFFCTTVSNSGVIGWVCLAILIVL